MVIKLTPGITAGGFYFNRSADGKIKNPQTLFRMFEGFIKFVNQKIVNLFLDIKSIYFLASGAAGAIGAIVAPAWAEGFLISTTSISKHKGEKGAIPACG